MPVRFQTVSASPVPLIGLVLLLAAGGGLIIAQAGPGLSLGAALLVVLLLLSVLHAELGLHIILLSMLLSPEIVLGSVGGVSIGKPEVKGDVLVLRVEDLVLTAVTVAWLARTAIFKELGLIRRTPLNAPIFAYGVSLVLATLLGVYTGNVRPMRGFFYTVKYIEYFVVFFMAANYIRDARQVRRLLGTALATCAISAIIGIAQIPSGERVAAPFEGKYGEPNTFGGYLVLMLALTLAFALSADAVPAQVGWIAFAVLLVVPLLFTLSRSSWLACVPMLLTLALLSRRRLLLLIGMGVLIVVGPLAFPRQVVDRYNYTLSATEDRGDYRVGDARLDSSSSARLDSWLQGLRGWTARPFFGYGVTGFAFMDAQYVRVLVEAGLLGLVAFCWLLVRLLRLGWEAVRRHADTPFEGLALGYLAGLVALMAHSIGANTFIIVRIMEPFWFLTGVIAVLPALQTQGLPTGPATGRRALPGPPPSPVPQRP
jgi:O-antigen ligase